MSCECDYFSLVCVFLFFVSHKLGIRSNSLHLPPNFRLYNNLFYLQNNLEGRLPSYMASLTSLEYLSFSNNNFLIPSTFSFIFNLSNLKIQLCDNNILALEPTLLLGCKLYWTWIQILYLETRTNYCLCQVSNDILILTTLWNLFYMFHF